MGDFYELMKKYGLFAQLYHVWSENMSEMVRESRPILLRFLRILGVEENKADRAKLRGMSRYFGSRKCQSMLGFSQSTGTRLAGAGVAALEKMNKFDDIIRKKIPQAEDELDHMEGKFNALNQANMSFAAQGKNKLEAMTKKWRIQLIKDHPKVNFSEPVWLPKGEKIQEAPLVRKQMVSIPACTGFVVRSNKSGYYVEIAPSQTAPIQTGMPIEANLAKKGLTKATVAAVDNRLGRVTARLADGSTRDLPFNMFRPAGSNAQVPVYDPKGNFWFTIAIAAIILGVLSLFANVFLLCSGSTSRRAKPVSKRNRFDSPRERISSDQSDVEIVVESPEASQEASSAWSNVNSALRVSRKFRTSRRSRRSRRHKPRRA